MCQLTIGWACNELKYWRGDESTWLGGYSFYNQLIS